MGHATTTSADPTRASGPEKIERHELIDRYGDLVYKVAHKIKQSVPDGVDLEDLVAWGYAGLLEAYQRYTDEKSTRFATYAYYRVRGAILDACQEPLLDTRRRLAETGCNEVLQVYAHIVRSHRGQASLEDRLSMLSDVTGSIQMVYVLRECPSRSLRPEGAPHRERLVRQQVAEKVRQIVKERLEPTERDVLERMYFKGQTMTEIAEELDYSPSWVSRIHSRALTHLQRLIEREDEWSDLRHSLPV